MISAGTAAMGTAAAVAVLAGPALRSPSLSVALGLVAGAVAAWGLRRVPSRAGAAILAAGALLALAVLAASPSVALGPAARWFSPAGLVYANPAVWLGLAGALVPAGRASAGAALVLAAVHAFAPSAAGGALEACVLTVLIPAMAAALEAAGRSAQAHPLVWIGAAGAALATWNFLFMEQYRRNLIPRDDTVSFRDVAATNAALFESAFGDPGTWPASWLFAARHRVSPARYGAVASAGTLFQENDTEVVDLQNAPAPLLVPLSSPSAIDLGLEGSGHGALDVLVNGERAATVPLTENAGEVRLRVPHGFWRRGVNELTLVSAADRAPTLHRLTLRRVGGPT